MPILSTKNVSKRFRKKTAVDDVTLSIESGRVFALLGRNGAGKTTFLRMLAGILRPDRGVIEIMGRAPHKLGEKGRAQLGYVSENQEMPDWMTVRQLLAYLRPMYPTWDDVFCARLVKLFELPLDQKLASFSRGMRMKAAFVSSLAYHPRMLLLDEPFAGLDQVVLTDLLDALLELITQEEWTMVVSSHDIDEVERLADEVGIIEEGKLILHEELEALQSRFRRAEFLTPSGSPAAAPFPAEWKDVRHLHRSVALVDTAYHETASEARIRPVFPDAQDIVFQPMSLQDIYVQIVRPNRPQEQPELLAAS